MDNVQIAVLVFGHQRLSEEVSAAAQEGRGSALIQVNEFLVVRRAVRLRASNAHMQHTYTLGQEKKKRKVTAHSVVLLLANVIFPKHCLVPDTHSIKCTRDVQCM